MVIISSDLHIFYFYQNKKTLAQMFYISVVIDTHACIVYGWPSTFIHYNTCRNSPVHLFCLKVQGIKPETSVVAALLGGNIYKVHRRT